MNVTALRRHEVVTSLLVSDLTAVHLLDEQISFAHVVPPHIHLAIGNPDVDALHSAHQVIHQALAIPAYNVDEGIGWRRAVVNCHLQVTRHLGSPAHIDGVEESSRHVLLSLNRVQQSQWSSWWHVMHRVTR